MSDRSPGGQPARGFSDRLSPLIARGGVVPVPLLLLRYQARLDLSYAAGTPPRYRGTVLVATRTDGPAGVVAVLGDDRLTAGEVGLVVDSAHWVA